MKTAQALPPAPLYHERIKASTPEAIAEVIVHKLALSDEAYADLSGRLAKDIALALHERDVAWYMLAAKFEIRADITDTYMLRASQAIDDGDLAAARDAIRGRR